MRLVAVIAQSSSPPPSAGTISYPVEGIILGTGVFVLGGGWWLIKTLVGREVKAWADRMGRVEGEVEKQVAGNRAVEILNERQSHALEVLAKTVDELAKSVAAISDGQRQLLTLAERQNTFDQRLQNYGGALQDIQRLYQESQREMMALRAELASSYVRHEDWVRFVGTLDAKMDAQQRQMADFKDLVVSMIRGKND